MKSNNLKDRSTCFLFVLLQVCVDKLACFWGYGVGVVWGVVEVEQEVIHCKIPLAGVAVEM
jgi:hypothetical protein